MIAIQATALPDPEALVAYSIERRIAFERAVAMSAAIDDGEPGFAVRIGSEPSREAALRLADRFDSDAHPARIVAWSGFSGDYFDVHLSGYLEYTAAAEDAYELNTLGVAADVIPLGNASDNLFE